MHDRSRSPSPSAEVLNPIEEKPYQLLGSPLLGYLKEWLDSTERTFESVEESTLQSGSTLCGSDTNNFTDGVAEDICDDMAYI
jgi:hypothetical protein